MLSEMLSDIGQKYQFERVKKFAGNSLAEFIRHDLALEAKKNLTFWPFDLTVKSSAGAGNWASIPWLAFFDPLITDTATRGFYVVYLIDPIKESFTLSMNQGTTAVYDEYGRNRGRQVLRRRAIDIADRINDFASQFDRAPIDLGSREDLPQGYEAGHSFGRVYRAHQVGEDKLITDLRLMLHAYGALVERGGLTPVDAMHEQSGSTDIEETRKYVLTRRIERSPKVREAVLAERNSICESCGLDPKRDYGYNGKPELTPLDVHHAAPLMHLAEGETRRYRIPDDFIVLCPTCHRMIHKQDDPSDLETLRRCVRFKFMRELGF